MTSTSNLSTFKPTYLYIKQHSVTGKLYFGKTIQNPLKYSGSGTYWQKHINKHGKEHVVTLWYELFTDKDELISFALQFSKEMNIVESNSWLNLMNEDGIGLSHEARSKIVENKKGKTTWNKGIPRTQQEKIKMSTTRKLRSIDPNWNIRPPCSKEKAQKIKISNTNRKWIFNKNTNERRNVSHEEFVTFINSGWTAGIGQRKSSSLKGTQSDYKWWTNDIINIMSKEQPDKSFYRGRIKNYSNHICCHHSSPK